MGCLTEKGEKIKFPGAKFQKAVYICFCFFFWMLAQYNDTLLILKKENHLSAFDK